MKTINCLLLALLCWTGIYAQEHEYVPMLREDLVWVGTCRFGDYHINVEGDTVLDGVSYKKVYRKFNQEAIEIDSDNAIYTYLAYGIYINNSTPAACLREEGGKVYRYCDDDGYQFDFDAAMSYNHEWIDSYNMANAADSHYEVLIYDLDNPNIYKQLRFPLHAETDVYIEGTPRRVLMSHHEAEITTYRPWLMIEGLGMLNGGDQGCDMLCPGRSENSKNRNLSQLGIRYVRNDKGDVLYFDDLWIEGFDAEGNYIFLSGDPYDFDGDNNFDIADVNAMINAMLGLREDNIIGNSLDLTFDQKVDLEDLNLVINRLLSGVKPVKYSELLAPETE